MSAQSKASVQKLDAKGLYLLLTSTGQTDKHHWALLLATSTATAIRSHLAHSNPSSHLAVEPMNLSDITGPLAAPKLGTVDGTSKEWVDRMKECVRGSKAAGESPCRSWALTALYELASEGFIGMIAEWERIRHIELEAKSLAREVGMVGEGVIVESRWSVL